MPQRPAKINIIYILLLSIFICFLMSGAFAADKVEINTASLQQLDTITGIGPVIAQRIIDARPFSSIDDLLKVKGIGEKTLQKIKDQGLAYVNGDSFPAGDLSRGDSDQTPITNEAPSPKPIEVAINYPEGIIFNKIMPSPTGPDETEEWIELKNLNDSEVDLSGWSIQDTIGSSTTYTFPADKKIPAKGFLILKRPETKIILNNDGDTLKLIQPNGNIIDTVTYERTPQGQSYNHTETGWIWNGAPISVKPSLTEIKPSLVENKDNVIKQGASLESSKIAEKIITQATETLKKQQEQNKKHYPVAITMAIALSSAATIFILKRFLKLDKN